MAFVPTPLWIKVEDSIMEHYPHKAYAPQITS
jgi:hypothetical protein